ncbi:hypothetical protein BYT27DRAFT_7214616 [Phlegmacium glaucopus]|nr:hypothetical protein BYT27DRAFT_7214616 [Phlegmacium glaucopus]
MNPWGKTEMKQVTHLSLIPTTEEQTVEIFECFGPIPRLCSEALTTTHPHYAKEVKIAISHLTVQDIERLFNDASGLSLDEFSHKLCLVSRVDQALVTSDVDVAPITPSIKSRIVNQFQNLQQSEQVCLYQCFARSPESKKVAGVFYEAFVQSRLWNGLSLELVPMVKPETSQKGKRKRSELETENQPKWQSSLGNVMGYPQNIAEHFFLFKSVEKWVAQNGQFLNLANPWSLIAVAYHMLFPDKALEASQKALEGQLALNIHPICTEEYTDGGIGIRPIEPSVLYVPDLMNQVAIDSFILLDNILYLFQITIALTHDIKHGLINLAKDLDFPPLNKWCFVFIIPPKIYLKDQGIIQHKLNPTTEVTPGDVPGMGLRIRGAKKNWNWFSALWIPDIDEQYEADRMFVMVPITQDYAELFVQ